MEHIEGEKIALMHNLVKLRKDEPRVREMCSKLHIMQQPSGFVDQTFQAWHTKHQSKQYPNKPLYKGLVHMGLTAISPAAGSP